MRIYLHLTIFLSLMLLTFCSVMQVQAAPSWKIQVVEENGAMGGNGRIYPIAVDSNDNPHMVYLSPYSDSKVTYASSDGLDWSTQTIIGGNAFSLVFDDDGTPHIMYTGLTYAYWTGTEWNSQTVDPNAPNAFASLALDSLGNPHVAYTDHTTIKYARWTGSNWDIQTVDTHSEIPFRLSLALDQNDSPYIAYDFTISIPTGKKDIYRHIEQVKLATLKDSQWHIQTVAYGFDFGNMVLDSKGNPHMIYRVDQGAQGSNDTLVYAHWDEENWWTTQAVVSDVCLDNTGFLVLDSNDYPHISYVGTVYNPEIGENEYVLRYTRWTGTEWNTLTVNPDSRAVGPCYLALDSNGNPHISYRTFHPEDSRSAYIMYATTTLPPIPLNVSIVSPENTTYTTNEIPLNFKTNKPISSTYYYSLDGEANVAITENTTLTNLTNGTHNLTIYAEDNNGNTEASETIYFTVTKEADSTLLLISAAIITAIAIIVVVYVWKTKYQKPVLFDGD
jgi:hypothetical protein